MATKVLCIGAHNDEIMADMGGTVHELHKSGCEILILNLACKYLDINNTLSEEDKQRYQKEEISAARILGADLKSENDRESLLFLESAKAIEYTARVIMDFAPDIVFIHLPRDNHFEHREVAKTSYKALCVAASCGTNFSEVYAFQTGIRQSAQYCRPDFFVDVTDDLDTVKESLLQFKQKYAPGEALAKTYELQRQYEGLIAKVPYAEEFKIVKFPNGSDDILLKKLLGKKFIWYGHGSYPAFGENYF
ncbi:MAG: hypothetical protein E7640_00695 [Ruminococcaceae bacterium]|nr:hypothetical protein [Oscillospiraceae bacterium]